jgi:acyl carrier protein
MALAGEIINMQSLPQVKKVLRDALQIGARADELDADSPLLGGLPEFDSMAVVAVTTMLEDRFGIIIDDDELSADVFATVGTLAHFVDGKMMSR